MRILNVTAQKPDSTGSGVYLAQTVRCELAFGHEAAVVCGLDSADELSLPEGALAFPVRFSTPELPFHVCGMSDQMPYPATRYRDLTPAMTVSFERAFSERVDGALESFRPDAVVCHHLYLATAVVCSRVRAWNAERGGDVRVYAVCHSTDLRQTRSHGLERDFIAREVRGLDGMFALHGAQRAEIEELYGADPSKVRVIGAGYDASVFTREREGEDRGLRSGLHLLYVGKIWEKKGVSCLLGAFDAFDAGEGVATLSLAGGHNDEDEYARIVERARRCRRPVEFLGKLSPKELAVRYRRADVFVLPSFFEGLPLVVVEALACGCRVVVTDLPGIRPWLSSSVPDAPVVYVRAPRMEGVDTPVASDLPAFEGRLARALEEAAALPPCRSDMSSLTWEGVTRKMLAVIEEDAGGAGK